MRIRFAAAVAAAASLATLAAAAGPLEDGEAAYNHGDYGAAFHDWMPLAEKGDARAENGIGVLYHNGQGVPQDDFAAVLWYRRAADQDYPVAQYNLGLEYLKGTGIPKNDVEAAKWFAKAAQNNYPPAERELGTLYYDGRGGLEQSTAEGSRWWRMAAAAGDAEAAKLLKQAAARRPDAAPASSKN